MGMPTTFSKSGTTGTFTWITDWMQNPVNISVQVTNTASSCSLRYTNSDPNAVTPIWQTLATGITTSLFTSIAFPVVAMQFNINTAEATAVATATFVQATFGR